MNPQEFAMLDAQAHQYYDQTHPQNVASAQAKPKASGNFLTHLLPTVGGTGGAIGGAAIGTALLPGIGTLAGALLGGALGGGASKVGENAIEHQKLGSGVAGQAIEQGVLGAGPLRLAKAATFGTKAAVDVAKAGGGLEEALNAANQVIKKPATNIAKNLVNQGEAAQGRVVGTSSGKLGSEFQSPQDNARMLETIKNEKISVGNANNTYRDLQDKLDTYGKGISDHFANNNTPLSRQEVNSLAKDYIANLKTTDPRVVKEANVIANDLKSNVNDTQSLWEFRKSLDSRIPDKKLAAGDNVLSNQMKAIKVGRQFLADKLGKAPGLDQYHSLSEIKPFVASEAQRANNITGGVFQRIVGSGPIQKLEAQTGKAMQGAGKALGGGATDVATVPGLTPGAIAGRTVPFGALSAASSGLSQPATTADTSQPGQPQQPQDLTSALMGAQGLGQDAQSQQPTSQNPYSQENLMADIQRDPAHASNYISTYESLDKIFNPPDATTKPLNSTQQQQAFNAQSGLDSLGEIANVLQQNPNAAKLASIPGGSLAANLTHTGSYQAAINNATDVIGRLRSGGAIGQQEEIQFKKLLPAFGDNPDTINYKLQQLSHVFQQFANPQASQPGSSDLTSALMQAGYGQ